MSITSLQRQLLLRSTQATTATKRPSPQERFRHHAVYKRPITKLVLLQAQETSKGESSFVGRDVQSQEQV